MKKLISAILILLLCLGIYSCGKNDAASTATTASSPSVFLYAYNTSSRSGSYGNDVLYTCYGTNSSGYTSAPFFSTSSHDLKDRLPSSKWSYPVKSLQGHVISSSWENLWDGNIDMSLHQAEVIYDNDTEVGFWSATKSDGTFSGNNCRDWSAIYGNDNATWGSFLIKDSSLWIDNSTTTTCYTILFVYIFCVSCITEAYYTNY